MLIKLFLFFLLAFSAFCEDPTPQSGSNECLPGFFIFQNGSCLETCPTGYFAETFGSVESFFCNPPCTGGFVYQDDSCFSDCGRNFISRTVLDIAYCDLDPSLETSRESGRCPNVEYRYEDGTCRPTCSFPYVSRWDLDNAILYCDHAYRTDCLDGEVLEAEGCIDSSVYNQTSQNISLLTASVKVELSIEYIISSSGFIAERGPAKLVKKIASILNISTADVDIPEVKDMVSIVYASISVAADVIIRCLPNKDSMNAARESGMMMALVLYSALENGELNVLDDVSVRNHGFSIQVNDPAQRNPRPDQTEIVESPSSGKKDNSYEVGLAIGIGVMVVVMIGVFMYKNKLHKVKKLDQDAEDFKGKKYGKAGPEIDEEAQEQVASVKPPILEGVITMEK